MQRAKLGCDREYPQAVIPILDRDLRFGNDLSAAGAFQSDGWTRRRREIARSQNADRERPF